MMSKHKNFRSRAPLRLGLAGGGTDLSPYSDTHGGAVLNITIDRFAHASLRLTEKSEVKIDVLDMGASATHPMGHLPTDGPFALAAGVYNHVVERYLAGRPFGAEIATTIDAPPGSGLGASSALTVALLDSFRAAFELPLGEYDVAHGAFEIERVDLGLAGGKQDQYAASFGGVNFIEFLADDRVIVNPLRISDTILYDLQSSIVICFSGQSRASETVIREQVSAMSRNDAQVIENLHKLKRDAHDMKLALSRGDFSSLARLLNESWKAKKATASSVTNSHIDNLWSVAHNNGAFAGKVSGAGGGGFVMFLVDPDSRPRIFKALAEAGGVPGDVNLTKDGVVSWPTSI
ncbi:dehydrogenase [Achromobacter denitrificans]|uniref:GHMP family kinase ATP-binding protein n=1 Tax=Achromobacter denitrificans TaxID=32002 RepID=UPI00240E753F|nr:dehydrogenase [Achromobacter denitrificans]